MKKINPNFFVWLAILVVTLLIAWVFISAFMAARRHGPSFETQRADQRRVVFKRVLDAGGLDALRRDCEFLITNAHTDYLAWEPPRSNVHVTEFSNGVPFRSYVTDRDNGPLPSTISNLEPHEVQFDCDDKFPIVRIELFGMHRTGGWDIPYYDLWVVCGSTNYKYVPLMTSRPRWHINKIADSVFEVYQ